MQVHIGRLVDVTSAERENPANGNKWVEHTAHVLDGIDMLRITLQGPSRDGRSAGLPPATAKERVGTVCAFETYSRGHSNGRVYTTARRILTADELADALDSAAFESTTV